jgi:TPR repeat protein
MTMKRFALAVLLCTAGAAALADDLGDADTLLLAKDYGRAFPLYSKLANAGNTEAQFRLGEMYWYGDGTAVDLVQADAWLRKAAAKGHAGAAETLAILQQRKLRAADLAYWTQGYRGEDLAGGKYACRTPDLPAASRTKAEIQATSDAITKWESCYQGFVVAVNAGGNPLRRIPADVLQLMSPREAEQAGKHIDAALAQLVDRRQAEAFSFAARSQIWFGATSKLVLAGHTQAEIDGERIEYDIRRYALESKPVRLRTGPIAIERPTGGVVR